MDTSLIGKKLITKNIIINLLGNIVPMLFIIFSIPYIINSIGKEEFGILSFAWLFLGYFSILDLGIGRATTKLIIDFNSNGNRGEIRSLTWTSIVFLFVFGSLMGSLTLIVAYFALEQILNIPPNLIPLTKDTFYIIAFTIPFVTGVAAAKGVLEAQQKFLLLNIIKIPSSVLNYVIPVVVAFYSGSLALTVLLLAITRVLLFFIHIHYSFKGLGEDTGKISFQLKHVVKLVRYGGWLTVSNIIGPIMVYFDRFIVGSILTLALLAYYTTPYEVVTKITVIAGSVSAVLFPVFANLFATDRDKMTDFYNKSVKGMSLLLFPVTVFIAIFASDILLLWLGADFSEQSSTVMLLLSAGVFLNCVSAIPYTAIQAFNRPDLTAKVHLIQLPLYLIALYVLATHFDINGVAIVWAVRNLVDLIIFTLLFYRLNRSHQKNQLYLFFTPFSLVIGAFFLCSLFQYHVLWYKIVLFTSISTVFITVFWKKWLNSEERAMAQSLFSKIWMK